jgi:putative hydrolase of the HAD superfamily
MLIQMRWKREGDHFEDFRYIRSMKNYRHLYFDLDRTLWDFDSNSYDALSDIFEEFGLHQCSSDRKEFIDRYHFHNEQLWANYRKGEMTKELLRSERFRLTLEGATTGNHELALRIGESYLGKSVEKTKIFPNTHEVLTYLKDKGYYMYILPNGFRETQFAKLKNCKLGGYFEKVFTSETIGINKPNPEIFHWAVTSVNAKKTECLIIGDDPEVDILGAKNYGIDSVFFNPLHESTEIKASYEITDLLELKSFL